ncbi:MAG: protein kinase, partial [Myxococcota bacterium]|nr:protein kinase [Myxococcota bacterium]
MTSDEATPRARASDSDASRVGTEGAVGEEERRQDMLVAFAAWGAEGTSDRLSDIPNAEAQSLDLPERIGRYRVVGRLAVGGMAEILIGALDGAFGLSRPVVIKRVLPSLARRADFRRMFVDEARIVSGLRHPNVVDVLEVGQDDSLYLVMEYLEGESLDVLARRLRPTGARLPPAVAAYVVAEAAAGLHAAHELEDASGAPQQIVHRDVTPHNLFVGYDGSVRVIDFGIAKAVNRETRTATGTLKGKFAYMSPEQIDGQHVDRRVDVFALGVVLWELLTGERLFARPSQIEIVKAICFAPIPAAREVDGGIDAELDRIAQKALSRELDERYASADALRLDLVGAIRALAPEGAPQEDLAALMRTTFDERIAQRRGLLREIASGGAVTSVPRIDDDELEPGEHAESTEVAASSEAAPTRARTWAPRAWTIGISAVAIGIGVGVGLALVIPPRGPDEGARPPAPALATDVAPGADVAADERAASESDDDAPGVEAAPPPAVVAVSIET